MDNLSDCEEILSDNEVEENDPYFQNIAEKMQIARNVVIECEILNKCPNNSYSEIENIIRYTGAPEETIKMADMSLKVGKTFTEWFQDVEFSKDNNKLTLAFEHIRNLMLQLYTKSMQVASKESMTRLMDEKEQNKYYIDFHRFKHGLSKNGFISKLLPGTKRSILVERTEESLKRMEYLTRMKAYREAGRLIVYADPCFYFYDIAVSPQHGVLHRGTDYIRKNKDNANDLFAIKIVSIVPPNSVVVLKENLQNKSDLPTPFTPKTDMISWLTDQSIPHDPTLHKADLYALIEKFSTKDDRLTNFFKCHGHDVVYRPKELKSIDYLEVSWSGAATVECNIKRKTLKQMKGFHEKSIDEWQQIEKLIISREEKMYQEDMLLEAVVDKLLTLAKYGELSEADLNECDDDDLPQDDYYSSIIYD